MLELILPRLSRRSARGVRGVSALLFVAFGMTLPPLSLPRRRARCLGPPRVLGSSVLRLEHRAREPCLLYLLL